MSLRGCSIRAHELVPPYLNAFCTAKVPGRQPASVVIVQPFALASSGGKSDVRFGNTDCCSIIVLRYAPWGDRCDGNWEVGSRADRGRQSRRGPQPRPPPSHSWLRDGDGL